MYYIEGSMGNYGYGCVLGVRNPALAFGQRDAST